jgi:hypothetical protein
MPPQLRLVLQRNAAGNASTGWTLRDILRVTIVARAALRSYGKPPSTRVIADFFYADCGLLAPSGSRYSHSNVKLVVRASSLTTAARRAVLHHLETQGPRNRAFSISSLASHKGFFLLRSRGAGSGIAPDLIAATELRLVNAMAAAPVAWTVSRVDAAVADELRKLQLAALVATLEKRVELAPLLEHSGEVHFSTAAQSAIEAQFLAFGSDARLELALGRNCDAMTRVVTALKQLLHTTKRKTRNKGDKIEEREAPVAKRHAGAPIHGKAAGQPREPNRVAKAAAPAPAASTAVNAAATTATAAVEQRQPEQTQQEHTAAQAAALQAATAPAAWQAAALTAAEAAADREHVTSLSAAALAQVAGCVAHGALQPLLPAASFSHARAAALAAIRHTSAPAATHPRWQRC